MNYVISKAAVEPNRAEQNRIEFAMSFVMLFAILFALLYCLLCF